MGELYVVMSGEFEEQIILTVCTNRKKAQEIANFFNSENRDCTARVYEIENGDNWDTKKAVYNVVFNYEFKISDCKLCRIVGEDHEKNFPYWFEIREDKSNLYKLYETYVCAESREQAIEKARKKLTEYAIKKLELKGFNDADK